MTKLCDSMAAMNATLARMPEQCSPEIYYAKVRPYIWGFTDITYEGCFDNEPQSFRGETGAQSSIIPSIINALGIRHKDSMLTHHLEEMKDYMPEEHLEYMDMAAKCGIKGYVLQCVTKNDNANAVRTAYNDCIEQLITFRSKHFDYAVNYIEKRVENPTGTGGTPYVKWLGELIQETRTYFFPEFQQ
jgi:indoleamine 2,3-dioxygenase